MRASSSTLQACGLILGHCVPYKYTTSTRQLTQHFCTPYLRIFTLPGGGRGGDSHPHFPDEGAEAQRSWASRPHPTDVWGRNADAGLPGQRLLSSLVLRLVFDFCSQLLKHR